MWLPTPQSQRIDRFVVFTWRGTRSTRSDGKDPRRIVSDKAVENLVVVHIWFSGNWIRQNSGRSLIKNLTWPAYGFLSHRFLSACLSFGHQFPTSRCSFTSTSLFLTRRSTSRVYWLTLIRWLANILGSLKQPINVEFLRRVDRPQSNIEWQLI